MEQAIPTAKPKAGISQMTFLDMHILNTTNMQQTFRQLIKMELQEKAQKAHVPAISFALIYQGLGKTDQAFDWFEKAIEEPHGSLLELHASPVFDTLHSHPRYEDLLRKMNLEP